MPAAARVWRAVSTLRIDACGIGRPAGYSVTNPGPVASVMVTLRASATAWVGTPAGKGSVKAAPGANLAPLRESNRRVEGRATNRPATADVAGTKAPTTSMTTSAGT